jgi:predicted MFS family arabinose efflux permease
LVNRKDELPAAVALNSVGVNISRAIGPALVGVLTVGVGIAAPFWINAVANLGSIGGLLWWRPPRQRGSRLPAERFFAAIRTGARYARNNPSLRATVFRAIGFFFSQARIGPCCRSLRARRSGAAQRSTATC